MRLRLCLVSILVLTTLGSASTVEATTPSTAVDEATRHQARDLFMQGVEAFNAGHAEEARVKFESAYEMVHEPSILYNLGNAQVETGHLLEARASYQRFLAEVTSGPAARSRRDAQRALTALDARIPQVRARIAGTAEGDQVLLDGQEVTSQALTRGAPVEPGAHELVVRRGGREWAHERFTVAEGERKTLEVALVEPTRAPTPEETARAANLEEERPRTPRDVRRRRIIIGSSVAGGVVLVGAAILTTILVVHANH